MPANQPIAVLVGLCGHGLAIARALSRHGVAVHALEADRSLPGTRTRHATVHFVADINGSGLIDALLELRVQLGRERPSPILFLTNDNMVREVARGWQRIAGLYRLSWSECRGAVATLLCKSSLQAQCERNGLPYPRTWLLERADMASGLARVLSFPVLVKPVKPLSAFKARVVHSVVELYRLIEDFPGELPFLVQDWIAGSEAALSFCALYLDNGRILARFDGRKLRSRPMGHTTVAEPAADAAVFRAAQQFFDGLKLSGPVSLELKRDETGRLWVIEPTVGRTDFWLGCCVANGVDLPYLEYCHQAGLELPQSRQQHRYAWLNAERDPLSLLWYAWQAAKGTIPRRPLALLYLARDDLRPWLASLARLPSRLLNKITAKFRALAGSEHDDDGAESQRDSFRLAVGRMKWQNRLLYPVDRILSRLSAGRARLRKYYFVAQPVHGTSWLGPHRGRRIEIRRIDAPDPVLAQLPRPSWVLPYRFDQGAVCLAALDAGKLIGCIWLIFGPYQEDEVRCRFLPEGDAAWDFDVYVDPAHRNGIAFLKLWDAANALLRSRRTRWSLSRISAFNTGSLRSHNKLGAQRLGAAIFLSLGTLQISAATVRPYLHWSARGDSFPRYSLNAEHLEAEFAYKP